jgi:hypothetical protein
MLLLLLLCMLTLYCVCSHDGLSPDFLTLHPRNPAICSRPNSRILGQS